MPGSHSSIGRRDFLVVSAAAGAIGAFIPTSAAQAETTSPPATGVETLARASTEVPPGAAVAGAFAIGAAAMAQPSGDTSIRPFRFHASDEALADLRRRIIATRWPSKELVDDATQGVRLETMRKLADYWAKHDWRVMEARLNALPQFVTNIDGVDIHFIHVRAKQPNALPVIITHGWPGSIIEQLKVIDPLTNPTAHGGERG